jgi:glyoxylase-like metal-dependent hydrolase (beta-lactamase superfamily II)
MRIAIIFIVSLFFLSYAAIADFNDQDYSIIDLKTIKVADKLYMLQGVNGFAGGNLAISVGEDGCLMVDDQLAPMSEKIKQKLSEFECKKLNFVLNTHWHGDHTGGNASFSDQATIIAHENVRNRMSSQQDGFFGKTPASAKEAWPVITFDESLSIHFNNEEVKFLHLPNGHTDGDGVVYFVESNVAHMGDLLFTGVFPFVDLDSGGNVFNYTENLQAVLECLPEDAIVIPGHGELTDVSGIKSTHAMLLATTMYVVAMAEEGKTLSEIQTEGLPEMWKT